MQLYQAGPGSQRRLLLLCSHSTTPAAMTWLLPPAAPGLGSSLRGGPLTPHPAPLLGKQLDSRALMMPEWVGLGLGEELLVLG